MSHLHRFHVAPEALSAERIDLPAHEAHHALRVARVRVGDTVSLFDGTGGEVSGPVAKADRDGVAVSVETRRQESPAQDGLTLAQAWLNREKSVERIILRGTELGVTRFVFFRGDHSERGPRRNDKWNRFAVEACKQCGRLFLPEFVLQDDLTAALGAVEGDALLATIEPPHVPLASALAERNHALVAIGPEGDFSEAELAAAERAGAARVSLGEATLRSEIAAVTAVTLIQYERGQLGARA